VSDQSEDAGGEGVDWPPGLPPLASTQPLKGGFICSTTMGFLADGREVVVKRCPYPAEVESDGLATLGAAGAPVPAVLGVAGHVLVLSHRRAAPADRGPLRLAPRQLPGHDPPAQRLE
jgi:hypothetical protein